ncbi:hypothetical protein ACF0H5_014629 [Mactra antiquata]
MHALLFLCFVAFVRGQFDTSVMRHYLDLSFARYDHTPMDGVIEEVEWDSTVYKDDANNDTCVNVIEYANAHTCPKKLDLFHHYDHNQDSCLKVGDLSEEFHSIDFNNDNIVSLKEWEDYFIQLTRHLFPTFGTAPGK